MRFNFTSLSKVLPALVICFGFTKIHAQTTETKQVIVATSGKFGDPDNYVRIGAYNPLTKVYTIFDSVRTTSVRSILVEENTAYVAADTLILKYDLETNTRIAMDTTSGLNAPGGYLALYNDYILATRGYGATQNYLIGYNKSDLKQAFVIGGISDQAAGITVYGDTAYVGVAGQFFSKTGAIAVIDLKNRQFKREINLDTLGAGINKVYSDENNVYTINSKYSVITTYNITTGAIQHKPGFTAGSSGSAVDFYNNMLYTDFGYAGIGSYNLSKDSAQAGLLINYNKIPGVSTFTNTVSAAAYDRVNGNFYVAATDYAASGETYVFDGNGNITDTFSVGIAPEAIAMHYIYTVGGIEDKTNKLQLSTYPNPAQNTLHITAAESGNAFISITSLCGKVVLQQSTQGNLTNVKINISTLPQGMYILNITTEKGSGFTKFIKQ